jgi:hypothetical protein
LLGIIGESSQANNISGALLSTPSGEAEKLIFDDNAANSGNLFVNKQQWARDGYVYGKIIRCSSGFLEKMVLKHNDFRKAPNL